MENGEFGIRVVSSKEVDQAKSRLPNEQANCQSANQQVKSRSTNDQAKCQSVKDEARHNLGNNEIKGDPQKDDAIHLDSPNDKLVGLFNRFFESVGVICVLGASITFSVVVSDFKDPADLDVSRKAYFDKSTVRIFLSISWLLFTLGLGAAPAFAIFINFNQQPKQKRAALPQDDESPARLRTDTTTPNWSWLHAVASSVLYTLVLGGLMFLSLVVAAYVKVVGFVAVGFTSSIAVLVVLFQVRQLYWTIWLRRGRMPQSSLSSRLLGAPSQKS